MAYKVFTNGSPLPASDLNTYLMNQSVMVFANSTARSAALTSPTEGMTTYLEDTNKVEVWTGAAWTDINDNSAAIPKSTVTTAGDLIVADGNASVTRLGIGTNGQVLSSNGTTATWTTPAGGGGITQIASTSLSGGSITFNSIPQTYKSLKLAIYNPLINSGNQGVSIQPNSTANVADYMDSTQFTGDSVTPFAVGSFDFYFEVTTSGSNNAIIYELENYTSTTASKPTLLYGMAERSTGRRVTSQFGSTRINSAITSLRVLNFSGGTFTGGTATLFGVN